MKLGVAYNVFDDSLELLKASIDCIRKSTHLIAVVYQDISNHLNKADVNIKEYLEHLQNIGLIDVIYHYKPTVNVNNTNSTCHSNEFQKRLIGYEIIKSNSCTHFLSMDCDEMYNKKEFAKALKRIEKMDYDSTCVRIQDYHKSPFYQVQKLANYYVPFVHKITCKPSLTRNFYCYVDPTRIVEGYIKTRILDDIVMNHMTTIRLDLYKKYKNSSALIDFHNKIEEMVNNINNYNPESINNDVKVNILQYDQFNIYQSIGYYKAFYGIKE